MSNLMEQRATLLAACRDVAEGAKSAGRDLSQDEIAGINAKLDEVKSIDDKIVRAKEGASILAQLGDLTRVEPDRPHGNDTRAKSPGEHFVKYAAKRLAEVKGTRFSVGAPEWSQKAASDTHVTTGLTFPQVDSTLVYDRRPAVVADLFSSGTLTSGAITYYVEGPSAGLPAPVSELGAKPQINYTYTTVTDTLSKIAGFVKVSDEMIEDLDFLVSEINSRLLYDLSIVEEAQLLNGTGVAPQILGLLNRAGIQTETSQSDQDNSSALFRAAMKVQYGGLLTADALVMNPLDYQSIRLQRDGNGQLIGGGPFQGQYGNGSVVFLPPLWGMNTVVTPAITVGTAVVGAFKQGGTVYRKGGIRVDSTNSDVDDFEHNRVTIRAEERIALAVRRPAAFCVVTLTVTP